MKIKCYQFIGILVLLVVISCTPQQKEKPVGPVHIAISKAVPIKSYQNYVNWLKYADSTVIWHDMYSLDYDSAISLLKNCDGLLMTGGTDIYPGRYGKEEDTARCWKPDFKRDTMEVLLLKNALDMGMPVMGICRGQQLMNVHLGGSLYIDLPTDLDTVVKHKLPKSYNCQHDLKLVEGSLLSGISEVKEGVVNSNHHQGIEKLATPLKGIAFTEDGLTESVEWADDTKTSFLLGVQWHPERMNYSNPLSGKIVHYFLEEVKEYKQDKNHE